MTFKQYRKKPVIIEARQLPLNAMDEGAAAIVEIMSFINSPHISFNENGLKIDTLEGTMLANYGDWIIKGIKGEFYPCKPDIFEQTYELVT